MQTPYQSDEWFTHPSRKAMAQKNDLVQYGKSLKAHAQRSDWQRAVALLSNLEVGKHTDLAGDFCIVTS